MGGSYADGLLYYQYYGGNWFAARNAITNYGLEAIQWWSGPAAAVQNVFSSVVNTPSTCALNNPVGAPGSSPSKSFVDLSFGFVGNNVIGGRQGVFGVFKDGSLSIAYLVESGNTFSFLPVNPNYAYDPAAILTVATAASVDVAGNTLVSGDMPIRVTAGCTNAIILANNFSGATLWGLWDQSAAGALAKSLVLKNTISCGNSFHLAAPYSDGSHWFLVQNDYVTNQVPVAPVWSPADLPVQYQP